MPMAPTTLRRTSPSLSMDLLLASALIALIAVVRLSPHAPNFTPVVAAALFAGTVFRSRSLALIVPAAAMLASDAIIGFDDWRISFVVYAGLALPAAIGLWGRRYRGIVALLPLAIGSSLIFFVTSNLAVWAFSGIYTLDLSGLVRCYVAALPFLRNTMTGDLAWTAALFASWWLAQRLIPAADRTPAKAISR